MSTRVADADGAPVTPRVGWVGLGTMGQPMAARVLAAGWPLTVWARSEERARPLLELGAHWAPDLAWLAQRSTHVVTMLRSSDDVQQVWQGLLPHLIAGTLAIDMTTAAPGVAAPLAQALHQRGVHWLDCPVTGGLAGAREGTLILFAGGEDGVLQGSQALLAQLGRRIVACGPAGSGYRIKLINQTLMAGALLGLAEGAALARAGGMQGSGLRDALNGSTGSGWMFDAYAQRMVDGGGAAGFTLAMLRKDMELALQAAAELGRTGTLLLRHALAVVEAACERHGAQAGVQALSWD